MSEFEGLHKLSQGEAAPSQPTPSEDGSWELNLGVKWFSRAGIVALLVGFAMALNYSFPYLNDVLIPEVKLLIGALMAFGLFLGGSFLHRRFQLLGRILQGGGLSLGYLTLYGAFFIPAVQIFSDPALQNVGWGLLFLYVGAMIACSRKMDSIAVAVLSLGFGYYTASYAGSQLVALLSATLLSLAAVSLGRAAPNSAAPWDWLPKVGFIGFIFIYLFWHWFGQSGAHYVSLLPETLFADHQDETIFLLVNWLLFHCSTVFPSLFTGEQTSGRTSFNATNSFIVYGLLVLTQSNPLFGNQGLLESIFALIHISAFILMSRLCPDAGVEQDDSQSKSHLLMSVLFSVLSVFAILDADMQPIALAGGAMLMGLLSQDKRYGAVYRTLACIILGVAFSSLLLFQWTAVPAIVLLLSVGSVALVGLFTENRVLKDCEDVFRISLMLLSSFVFLIALMVALESYWITFSIVLSGFAFLMGGFATAQRKYRWAGLAWIFLAGFRLLTIDLLTLETPYKILLFLALGVTLLIGSYGYNVLSRKLFESNVASTVSDDTLI